MPVVPTLYVDSVYKRFGGRNILNGVHFQCQSNEVLGILGRNGCGKSTLLKCVFGLVKADHFYGKIGDSYFSKGYQTRKIAYVPQTRVFSDRFSVKEAIELWGAPNHDSGFWQHETIQEIQCQKIVNLSGGQRRFLEVMLGLYSTADYILLDEPFSNLSPLAVAALMLEIQQVRSSKGIVLTDHYFEDVLAVSDRIMLLNHGGNYPIYSEEDLVTHGYIGSSRIG